MLVCNGVDSDSRVQKTARSAAEAGWDVTLLGRSPDSRHRSWELGKAEVRLLPVPTPLAKTPREARRPLLTRPFAYRPGSTAGYRTQQVKAWRSELRVRRAELLTRTRTADLSDGRARARLTCARARLAVPRMASKVAHRWVRFRKQQLDEVVKARGGTGTFWDRAGTAFWQKTMGDRAWRKLWPNLYDFELAYGHVVDELQPDLIHANDFRMLGVGARAKLRARAEGREVKLVWDAHEFLPGVRPWRDDVRWLPAHTAHEREYVPYADAAVTVSDSLARLLRNTHGLPHRPTVVLNAPDAATTRPGAGDEAGDGHGDGEGEGAPSLRERCGVDAATPLVVYSGGAAPQRGLATMVEALPALEGTHVALVVNSPLSGYVKGLRDRAAELGADDRLHVLPYVPYWQVVPFLAEADAGVIPIHHWTNHEIALITKFFEYAHARLPIVVSDVKTMAATTRETGLGEVFRAEDTDDYVRAVRAVLADPARYRAAYDTPGLLEQWTWEAQAERLDRVYTELLHPGSAPAPGRASGGAPDRAPDRGGEENADLCGGAREDRTAAGRAVRGHGAPGDGRRRGQPGGPEGERRGGALSG